MIDPHVYVPTSPTDASCVMCGELPSAHHDDAEPGPEPYAELSIERWPSHQPSPAQIALDFAIQNHAKANAADIVKRAEIFLAFLQPVVPSTVSSARLVTTVEPTNEGAHVNIKDAGEQISWAIQEQDIHGDVLDVNEGTATWTEDSGGTVLTLAPSEDGFSCVGTIVGAAGSHAAVSVSIDTGRTNEDGSAKVIVLADAILVTAGDVETASLVGTVGPTS